MPKPFKEGEKEVKERLKGKTGKERIREIEALLQELPDLGRDYRRLRSRLRKELEKLKRNISERSSSKKRSTRVLQKTGPRIALVGVTPTEKRLLLKALTDNNFSEPHHVGKMVYKDVPLQVIELPNVYPGLHKISKEIFSIMRDSEVVLFSVSSRSDLDILKTEMESAGYDYNDQRHIIVKFDDSLDSTPFQAVSFNDLDNLKEKIFEALHVKRIYTKNPDGTIGEPLLFDRNKKVTVKDVAARIHRDFVDYFKEARIWGPSSKFDGQRVGLHMELQDGDIVEIKKKRKKEP